MKQPLFTRACGALHAAGFSQQEIAAILVNESDLRDRFAMTALSGLMASMPQQYTKAAWRILIKDASELAYATADAMLTERLKD